MIHYYVCTKDSNLTGLLFHGVFVTVTPSKHGWLFVMTTTWDNLDVYGRGFDVAASTSQGSLEYIRWGMSIAYSLPDYKCNGKPNIENLFEMLKRSGYKCKWLFDWSFMYKLFEAYFATNIHSRELQSYSNEFG